MTQANTMVNNKFKLATRLNLETWLNDPLQVVPAYRNNRFGHPVQPLNIQWLGTIQSIEATLSQHGFILQKSTTNLQATLINLSKKEARRPPLIAWLYHNKPAKLLMTKATNQANTQIEIRLWHSNIHLFNTTLPLWVGAVNYRTLDNKKLTMNRYKEISYQFQHQPILEVLTDILPQNRVLILPSKSTTPNTILHND